MRTDLGPKIGQSSIHYADENGCSTLRSDPGCCLDADGLAQLGNPIDPVFGLEKRDYSQNIEERPLFSGKTQADNNSG